VPQKDLSADEANTKAAEAIDANATKVTLVKQDDGKWTLIVIDAAGQEV
jgi:hypothetical protein